MKPRLLLSSLLLLATCIAEAGELHRCVSQAGQVSYLSARCPSGQRTDRIVHFVPDPVSAPVSAITTSGSATRQRNGPRQRTRSIQKPQPSPCERAKAKRELQLQRLGLKRTFDDLSRIDSAVREVCMGF